MRRGGPILIVYCGKSTHFIIGYQYVLLAPHFTGIEDKDGSLFTGEYSSIKILSIFNVKINI